MGVPRLPYSSTVTSSRMRNASSDWLRMSVTRCWLVRTRPRVISASVYRTSSIRPSPPIIEYISASSVHAPPDASATWAQHTARDQPGGTRTIGGLPPGACGHQVLRAVLQLLVQAGDRHERVDLVRPLVGAEPRDAREPEREPRLVARGAHDHVEGDLDDDGGLHDPVAAIA